uniref:FERM domain containing 3 n=1 Tax=Myripristis murdjan TaxID=586833 RepID=A0A668AX62_9TELE
MVAADALRCQVKITTRRSLHLRIANHTARDVYVRLVGHGGRVAGTGMGPQKSTPKKKEEEEETSGALTISELVYSPCASMLPTPVDDSQGGVDLLFSSPVQSPARLLRELHADPDIQAQLEAERERDRAYERVRLAGRSRVSGVLSSSLRLLSSNERVNACVLSVARFVAVVMGVLLVAVPTLLLLLESDIDVSFLHEIRQTKKNVQMSVLTCNLTLYSVLTTGIS